MYSRDEMKALTDKVLNMAKADAVELEFTGGERSGTRWANSTITTNLIQFDQQFTVTVRYGNKTAMHLRRHPVHARGQQQRHRERPQPR